MREIVEIVMGGASHKMRPTFEAYGEIEAQLGALRPLYASVITGTATLDAVATIVCIGMRQVERDDGRPVDKDRCAKLIYEQGPWSDEIIESVSDYIAALGWTPDQRKKIAAEMEKQTEPTPSA